MANSVQVRPRGTMVVTVRITLQPGRDEDLIELIENTPKGALSAVILEAMRSGTNRQTTYETEWTDTPLQMGDLGMEL